MSNTSQSPRPHRSAPSLTLPTNERSVPASATISDAPASPMTPTRPRRALYMHTPPLHTPRNANERQREERKARIAQSVGWRSHLASFNEQLAVWLTNHTGTMLCAYIFAGIGVGSLIGVFTNNVFLAALFGSISSYFLQLVLLPILSVGQNVLSRHAEIQADEQFHATMRTLHDIEQVARHLDAQDTELLRQSDLLKSLVERLGATPLKPAAPPAPPAPPAMSPLSASSARGRPSRRARSSATPPAPSHSALSPPPSSSTRKAP